ncbi:type I secretion system permease/ATPase [Enterovibrio norvegicus]|uniref:Type I secretion system permease/ATPase n=1 Tax=Enterovibrio norvegicus TaxID=188144 RepID=A0ABV4KYF4_9GAMM
MLFSSIKPALGSVGLVSFAINLLMLTGPIFMLQIYDRVLASGSVPTLMVICGFAIILYSFFGMFDALRGRLLGRIGQKIDIQFSGNCFDLACRLPSKLGAKGSAFRPVQDLEQIRQFVASPGPAMFFDMPWLPFYLALVYLFHPLLGMVGIIGAIILVAFLALNEYLSKTPSEEASKESRHRQNLAEEGRTHSEVICAMGMQDALNRRWNQRNRTFLTRQRCAMDVSGIFGSATKTIRFMLQSGVLAMGAWLTIQQEISPGVMIAASILIGRALAPVEQAVSHWRGFQGARSAYTRLSKLLQLADAKPDLMDIPLPKAQLSIDSLACSPAGISRPVIHGVACQLNAGNAVAIIGPSGAGKSTLARTLAGLTPPLMGHVRFDGAELTRWSDNQLGQIIGYLPQDVQLFDGTIAENIARFSEQVDANKVLEASKLASIHEMILQFPDGYDTVIGTEGLALSGGMKQRVALARAMYGTPFLVVLDEPNSNLDADGDSALTAAIHSLKESGSIVIIVAHRPSALTAVDYVLMLGEGRMTSFLPKDKALGQLVNSVPKQESHRGR